MLRPSAVFLERANTTIRMKERDGTWTNRMLAIHSGVLLVREQVRSWQFYDKGALGLSARLGALFRTGPQR